MEWNLTHPFSWTEGTEGKVSWSVSKIAPGNHGPALLIAPVFLHRPSRQCTSFLGSQPKQLCRIYKLCKHSTNVNRVNDKGVTEAPHTHGNVQRHHEVSTGSFNCFHCHSSDSALYKYIKSYQVKQIGKGAWLKDIFKADWLSVKVNIFNSNERSFRVAW